MPVLEKTQRVRVVTVFNEKTLGTRHSAEEVAKNLSRHGVDVTLDEVDAAGRPIGEVLKSHTERARPFTRVGGVAERIAAKLFRCQLNRHAIWRVNRTAVVGIDPIRFAGENQSGHAREGTPASVKRFNSGPFCVT